MILNHTNLTVTDVRVAGEFLEKYFDLELMGIDDSMAFLSDGSGFILTLMQYKTGDKVEYPGNFHIGFFIESKEIVEETHQRLVDDGFDVTALRERHNSYGFYVEAPGNFTVEVGA